MLCDNIIWPVIGILLQSSFLLPFFQSRRPRRNENWSRCARRSLPTGQTRRVLSLVTLSPRNAASSDYDPSVFPAFLPSFVPLTFLTEGPTGSFPLPLSVSSFWHIDARARLSLPLSNARLSLSSLCLPSLSILHPFSGFLCFPLSLYTHLALSHSFFTPSINPPPTPIIVPLSLSLSLFLSLPLAFYRIYLAHLFATNTLPFCRRFFFVRVPSLTPPLLLWSSSNLATGNSPPFTSPSLTLSLSLLEHSLPGAHFLLDEKLLSRTVSRLNEPDADVIAPPRANFAQRTPRELVSKHPTRIPAPFATLDTNHPSVWTTHHARLTCARDCRNYKSVLTQWQLRYTLLPYEHLIGPVPRYSARSATMTFSSERGP